MKGETRRWVDAGIVLAKDPKALVTCPVCQKSTLEVTDQELGDRKIERHMRCPTCSSYNSILLVVPLSQ